MTNYTRRGIVVWVYSFRNLNALKKLGPIYYMSKRMNYLMMYVDEENMTETVAKIEKLHYVRSVDLSQLPDIDMTFEHALDGTAEPIDMTTNQKV